MQKKEIIEEKEKVVIKPRNVYCKIHTFCDICGKEFIEETKEWHTGTSGESIPIELDYILKDDLTGQRIQLYDDDNEFNKNFGEDGCYIHSTAYDICARCMQDKIFPYIQQLCGKEPEDTSYDT